MKGISSINQKTVLKYLDYMVARRLEPTTLDYSVRIMKFSLTFTKTDIDKPTEDDLSPEEEDKDQK
ncbi:hypothetical protein [Methanosarcina siciliae]|uniref:hypothetical protein n=1 Tax=Methanosarcina siciliae TaxID=38027 RepID=UPI0012E02557|nr:hypothetical protein [Methanosarcina siciliae]